MGDRALLAAARQGHRQVVKVLLSAGAKRTAPICTISRCSFGWDQSRSHDPSHAVYSRSKITTPRSNSLDSDTSVMPEPDHEEELASLRNIGPCTAKRLIEAGKSPDPKIIADVDADLKPLLRG